MKASLAFQIATLLGGADAFQCTLAAFKAILPSNATVVSATSIPENGTFTVSATDLGFPSSPSGLPALCAIEIHVPTPGNSSYGFGLFLPNKWNSRYLAIGNSGFAGGINWGQMGTGTGYGFAVMSTDTGHLSSSFDASWAYQKPEVVANWGYRAMHGSVELSKQVVKAFYSQTPKFSYYNGCSTGGRQGLKEAEMFPDDFDGIVAGSPAWWTSHLQPWSLKVGTYNLPVTADHYIPPALFSVVADEVVKQCDPQDGVTDSVISDPARCNFRPEALLCTGKNTTNSTTCLTSPQIGTLNLIYNDWVEANQTFIFPHLEIGSEGQWQTLVEGNVPNSLGTDYFKYMLDLGPNFTFTDFNPSLIALSDAINPGNATFRNFDLSPFYQKGKKLITYHGLSDGLIATGSSVYLYEQIARAMVPKGVVLDDFYRLFLVPGMQHCAGSPANMNAPTVFQGDGSGPLADAKHDVLLALMQWVENGTAPGSIIASKFAADQVTVTRQRPLCTYPLQAKWNGKCDVNAAENWSCQSLY